jgi:hypothetical protein
MPTQGRGHGTRQFPRVASRPPDPFRPTSNGRGRRDLSPAPMPGPTRGPYLPTSLFRGSLPRGRGAPTKKTRKQSDPDRAVAANRNPQKDLRVLVRKWLHSSRAFGGWLVNSHLSAKEFRRTSRDRSQIPAASADSAQWRIGRFVSWGDRCIGTRLAQSRKGAKKQFLICGFARDDMFNHSPYGLLLMSPRSFDSPGVIV